MMSNKITITNWRILIKKMVNYFVVVDNDHYTQKI